MKKIILIVISILLLAVAGTYLYVSMIDWNKHKDKIAQQFSEVTGKRVVFEGPVTFTILPSPYLSASNIKVYNQDGENMDTPLATIKSLIARLSLMPLIKGDFEVKMMSLVEPNILVEVLPDGKINWQSPLSDVQKDSLENVNITLDSVMLEKAKLNFVNSKHDIDVIIENLNAEVIAPSVFGPYRIEGSYIKDNNPEGFALSLGQLSESFATTLNFVLNHPTSQTFVRFDGTVLLKNDALSGNFIVESKKPVEFVNKTFKSFQLDNDYNYPLALSMQVDTNKTKIGMSNIVLKYGATAGAGNVLIPLAENEFAIEEEEPERRKVEVGFEMTDLDLLPVVHTFKKIINKYEQNDVEYKPNLKFDLIADVKAVNSVYDAQNVKDLNLSLDLIDNVLSVKNLSASMIGETSVRVSGDIFSDDDELTYNLKTSYNTTDLQKVAKWLGYDLEQVSPSTYKRSIANANLQGTLNTIKIAPFELTIDKTSLKGEVGVIRGSRNNVYMDVSSDSINFDNYLKAMPKEEQQKFFAERMAYRFKKLGFLNDVDLKMQAKLNLGIYENIPFENTQIDFDMANGVLNMNKLSIGGVGNASISAVGKVKGFGVAPQFENIKYDLATKDLSAFLNKFEIDFPKINLKNLKNFSSKGIVTGNLHKMVMKTISKLEYIDMIYGGQVQINGDTKFTSGEIDVRAPDFVKLMNDIDIKYAPNTFSLGIFNLASKVVTDENKIRVYDMNAYIGSNNFKGTILYDKKALLNDFTVNLKANKLEMERFFYNDQGGRENKVAFRGSNIENEEFIAKPFVDKVKINYAFYNKFNLKAKMEVGSLSYKSLMLNNAVVNFDLRDGLLKMDDLSGGFNTGMLNSNFEMVMSNNPTIDGRCELKNQKIVEGHWSGKKYGIKAGELNSRIKFATNISSTEEMLTGLNAEIDFDIMSPVVKGWNLAEIDEDLKKRDRSEGLNALVSENLQGGETIFDAANGAVNVVNGNYTFSNTVFNSPSWIVKMQDTGSLNSWDMDAQFEVNFVNDKVKPFSFILAGPMIAPNLSVDVKAITDTFDAHWAKVESDKKAAEKAHQDYLNELMNKQQNLAGNTQAKIDNELLPELVSRRELTNNQDILQQYQKVEIGIAEARKGLDEIANAALLVEFDENTTKSLNEQNTALLGLVNQLVLDVAKIYETDVKLRINGTYNQIVGLYNQSKISANTYRDQFGNYPKRLMMIKTLVDIEKDDNILKIKKNIEDDLLALDAINSQIVKDYIFIQNTKNVKELEDYAGKIAEFQESALKTTKALNDNINELFNYAEALTSAEEKAYEEKLKDEEIKKKLAENTGKISGAKGNDITVVRNIKDIRKLEADKAKEDMPVLDFTSRSPRGGVITKPTIIIDELMEEEDVKEESPPQDQPQSEEIDEKTILRRYDGEISKATGIITKN